MAPNQFAGAFDQWLKNRGKRFTKTLGVTLFVVVAVVDLAVAVFLREAPALVTAAGEEKQSDAWWVEREPEDYAAGWKWEELIQGLHDFSGDTVDVLLIAVARIFSLSVLLCLGIYVGTPCGAGSWSLDLWIMVCPCPAFRW